MRMYVASRFRNYRAVREAIDVLMANGHSITFDWTRTKEFDKQGDLAIDPEVDLTPHEKVTYAFADKRGCEEADAILLLWDEDMGGAYIEVGMGIANGAQIYVVGCERFTIFWALPNVHMFKSMVQLMMYLDVRGA